MKTIEQLLERNYLIFSSSSHTKPMSHHDEQIAETIIEEKLGALNLPYIKGTGIDHKDNFKTYYFVDIESLIGRNEFEKWGQVYGLLNFLGQEIHIRGFQSYSYVMKEKFSVVVRVKNIEWLDTIPERNYFITDSGRAFRLNFAKFSA